MSSFIVLCYHETTPEQVDELKQLVRDQGSQINHEYDAVANGFSFTIPEHNATIFNAFYDHEHIEHFGEDQEVTTQ
ncbi:hypothetical protein VTI28DRAFT_4949 [Corynascus sepedonium]